LIPGADPDHHVKLARLSGLTILQVAGRLDCDGVGACDCLLQVLHEQLKIPS